MTLSLPAMVLAVVYPLTLYWAFRHKPLWRAGLSLIALLLYFRGYIQIYIVFACILLAGLPYALGRFSGRLYLQRVMKIAIVLLALLLGFHLLPGFDRIVFFHGYTLSQHSAAFDIAYPLDKAIAAVLLLGYGVAVSTSRPPAIGYILFSSLLIVIAAMAFAVPAGYLGLDVKFKWPMLVWAYGNVFITCVAEEVFFRGVIQYHLYRRLKHRIEYAMPLALIVSAVIFALAHFAGGIDFVVIALIAGLGYGAIYAKTRNLLDSSMVHFLVNLAHIILFSYPHLAAAS